MIDKLIDRIAELKNPTVVGLDPRLEYIPEDIAAEARKLHGPTDAAVKYALLTYNKGIIDALCDIVPVAKPQIAFYEQFGARGVEAYLETIAYAKDAGMIVIGDVKRSDIASTAQAYSDGHIGRTDVFGVKTAFSRADFITVNPYLGGDSIEPFLKNCAEYDKGLFVLVKTSNKGSGDFQDLIVDGTPLYEICGQYVEKWGAGLVGRHGYSSIGAVVGATHPAVVAKLRKMLPRTFFLVPGYGAQGGAAADIAAAFDKNGVGAVVNSSRGIIAAYKTQGYRGMGYADAARAAALDMREDLRNRDI
ncbi:MAG: orotidine-5'-phosphate decarboxylase [Clostridiales bacterium]|nr:orotidine-5'-phosphate decarboxylase [Clostridiales bacterium]